MWPRFVRVGTGGPEIPGHQRIFYGEVRFMAPIDYNAEPLAVPLLSTVWREPRSVVIATEHWLPDERRDFRSRLRKAVEACRAARREGEKRHPWLFFVSREVTFDQLEFHADLEPGIDVLVCAMPRQQRRLRQSAWHAGHPEPGSDRPANPGPPWAGAVAETTTNPDASEEPTWFDAINLGGKQTDESPGRDDLQIESQHAVPDIAATPGLEQARPHVGHAEAQSESRPLASPELEAPGSLFQWIISGIRGLFG
jgi:hypothetical protein